MDTLLATHLKTQFEKYRLVSPLRKFFRREKKIISSKYEFGNYHFQYLEKIIEIPPSSSNI
jgi:hypothetical protein